MFTSVLLYEWFLMSKHRTSALNNQPSAIAIPSSVLDGLFRSQCRQYRCADGFVNGEQGREHADDGDGSQDDRHRGPRHIRADRHQMRSHRDERRGRCPRRGPTPSRNAFSQSTSHTSRDFKNPTDRNRASSLRRSRTFRSITVAKPSVPNKQAQSAQGLERGKIRVLHFQKTFQPPAHRFRIEAVVVQIRFQNVRDIVLLIRRRLDQEITVACLFRETCG